MDTQMIGCSFESEISNDRYSIFLDITKEGAQSLLHIREGLETLGQTAPYLATHILPHKVKGLQAGYLWGHEQELFDILDPGENMNKTLTDVDSRERILDEATFNDEGCHLLFEGENLKVICTVLYNFPHEADLLFFNISVRQLQKIAAGEPAYLV